MGRMGGRFVGQDVEDDQRIEGAEGAAKSVGVGRFDRHSVISGGEHPFTAHETAAQSGRVVVHRPEGAAFRAQVPLREGMIGIAVHMQHGVSIDSDECSATGDTDTTEAPLGLQHKHDTTVK